jgi:DNA-binding HxlR family transcriptional regulator
MDQSLPVKTPCDDQCPVRATAEVIEHKWTTLIVRELLGGKRRFSELERALASISPKVLSERLKELEAGQLVSRTVFPTVPPSTEYELTALGSELVHVIRAMQEFGSLLLAANPASRQAAGE